jgi:site-specific recombinase XerD
MKPGSAPLKSIRLLDQVRERIRYLHYSLSTEKIYLYWVKFLVRWHGRSGVMHHPREMGVNEVEAFLTMLATQRKVSASTHNQALSALLFLYREVLAIDLPWLDDIGRTQQKRRIPGVMTRDEVAGLLAQMEGETALLARLLYGTGMRPMEGVRLRVKNVDFDRLVIIVREAKGGKDRVVMLRRSLAAALRRQMFAVRTVQELLGHSSVSTTMIYTHVLKVTAGGTSSPLDALDFAAPLRHLDDAALAQMEAMPL